MVNLALLLAVLYSDAGGAGRVPPNPTIPWIRRCVYFW